MFKAITKLEDVQKAVAEKKEIRFSVQPNGVTIGCYQFIDSHTFDAPESLECRGIAFDSQGEIISRPLHKFFNIGEKEWLSLDKLLARDDVHAIFEKLDGSMIATALVDGALEWRSKKAFTSDVVGLAKRIVADNPRLGEFAKRVATHGATAIFELTHPDAQIVVQQDAPRLRLLHVRDNWSGAYLMLDPLNDIHRLIDEYSVEVVGRYAGTLSDAIESLGAMQNQEGFVVQFNSGDMVKIKCPWYQRLHRCITFLRERDIAMLALNEELDDVKGSLLEVGIDLTEVDKVETMLRNILVAALDEIEAAYSSGKDMDRKSFAIAHASNPLFGLMMSRYLGKDVDLNGWYVRNRLKDDFSLRILANGAVAEEMTS